MKQIFMILIGAVLYFALPKTTVSIPLNVYTVSSYVFLFVGIILGIGYAVIMTEWDKDKEKKNVR